MNLTWGTKGRDETGVEAKTDDVSKGAVKLSDDKQDTAVGNDYNNQCLEGAPGTGPVWVYYYISFNWLPSRSYYINLVRRDLNRAF